MGVQKKIRDQEKNQPNQPLTYATYLKVAELTSLQQPLSDPLVHDEMLFIIVHQTYELWFKQILFELDTLVENLENDTYISSFRLFDRVSEIFKVLIQQIEILETMTPVDFNRFRSHLKPASGFQSAQFRELELMAGAEPSEYLSLLSVQPEWKNKIKARVSKTNLRQAFLRVLSRAKLVKENKPEEIQKAILDIYNEPEHQLLHHLCEYLIRFDEQLSLWRFRHVQMVERMIGMKPGTGGSLGVAYLQETLKKRYFGELWQARTHMNGGKDY